MACLDISDGMGDQLAVDQAGFARYAADIFSGIRTLLGGVILLLFAIRHRETLRFRQNAWTYLVLSIFNIAGYYGLQTVGLRYLSAGLFSTLVFLQPILLGLFSWMWLGERMFPLKVIGLVLGFGGVIVISSGGMAGHLSVLGIVLGLASGLCWALGTIYMKKKVSGWTPFGR